MLAHQRFFAALRMTHWGHVFTACNKKGPRTCHAERQRSIWSHQLGGVAHLGFFAALRMTCRGHFLMACRKNMAPTCHSSLRSESEEAISSGWLPGILRCAQHDMARPFFHAAHGMSCSRFIWV